MSLQANAVIELLEELLQVEQDGVLTEVVTDLRTLARESPVLAEQNDEWAEGRRYLSLDILTRSRLTPQPTGQEDTPLQLSA